MNQTPAVEFPGGSIGNFIAACIRRKVLHAMGSAFPSGRSKGSLIAPLLTFADTLPTFAAKIRVHGVEV